MTLPPDPEVRRALVLALRRLAGRERFTGEIERQLSERGFSTEVVDDTIAYLRANRLLDDVRAAGRMADERSGRRAVGRERLREELIRKGAPGELADAAAAEIDDDEERASIQAALNSKKWSAGDRPRAARFLLSRGFDPDLMESELDGRFGERVD